MFFMPDDNSNQKEVCIVRKITKWDSEEYISIQLKSPDETIEQLLNKAISVAQTKDTTSERPGPGVN